jgi:DNA-binding response OmpR family regulator
MSKKKILIIDDEELIREVIKDFLEMEDILCDDTDNAEHGVDLIAQNTYNLVLLDRNLGRGKSKPEDTIAQIHKIHENLPIVILTGDTHCNDAYLQRIGASGIVFKPFQVTEFIERIEKFL